MLLRLIPPSTRRSIRSGRRCSSWSRSTGTRHPVGMASSRVYRGAPDQTSGAPLDHSLLSELVFDEHGLPRGFLHELRLARAQLSADAYLTGAMSARILAWSTAKGSLRDLTHELLGSQPGDWFYAGWHDQAALHVGAIRRGGVECLEGMVEQLDADRIQEGGDSMVGFLPADRSWLFSVDVSPEDGEFTVWMRTDAGDGLRSVQRIADEWSGV